MSLHSQRMVLLLLLIGIVSFGAVSAFVPCGSHQRYTACSTDECVPTCQNPNPRNCDYSICQRGCGCEAGYVRNEQGACIPPSRCYIKKCGPNEKFYNCPSNCPPTCDNPDPICNKACAPPGCACKRGFVRDEYSDCIPKDLCPSNKICGKNEMWSNNSCVPPAPCQKPHCLEKLPTYCPLYCTDGGCICKTGFLRTKAGKCVLEKDCPKDGDCDCEDDECDEECDYDEDDCDCDDCDCKKR